MPISDEMARATASMRRMQARREAERRAARFWPNGKLRPTVSLNEGRARVALVREAVPGSHGAEFWVTHSPGRDEFAAMRDDSAFANFESLGLLDPRALNGYVAFPKRHAPRLPHGDTGNIVQYIPVHGGVTWARKDSFMAVWGFDTLHHNSESQPRGDRDWILANCWVLYRGLMLAEKLWPEFRRASQGRRAELANQLLALVEEQPLLDKLGFGAMIGMLFGRVG